MRLSLTFGFHRRSSVLGARAALGVVDQDGVTYDEQRIFERSSVIAMAIDARRQHYPQETPFVYQPFAGKEDDFRYDAATAEQALRNYFLKDLAI
ncbi:MAG: hypothetical protein QGF53_15370 [Alphaproteobacteria bacterium]|jgi:hypothetical protein|nr:hypothetical protein [Alphaproteobacteria bacterium]